MERENERTIPDQMLENVVGGMEMPVGSYIWPVPSFRAVTITFTEPCEGGFYGGIFISGPGIFGAAVVAADSGTVSLDGYGSGGWGGGYGTYCQIDHDGGRSTLYAHLSTLTVFPGQVVSQGQLIGFVGATGDTGCPGLRFETRINGIRVDPMGEL